MKYPTLIDKAFLLKRTPLFGMLDFDLLLVIADKLGVVQQESGEAVFAKGDSASRMYFIVKGAIEISDGSQRPASLLRSPDFFGDESLFSDKTRAYSAICKTNVQLLSLSKTNLFTIISECPQVAMGFLQTYSSHNPFRPKKEVQNEHSN